MDITLNDNHVHEDIDDINNHNHNHNPNHNLDSTNTTGPNPEDSSNNSKDISDSSDDSENDSDSEIEQIDPELLKKMQEYQEKEQRQEIKEIRNIIENPIKEPLNITTFKSIDEIKNESSILTKQELIKLGQTYATENKEKELFEEKKIKVINFLKKYENIDLDNIVDDIIKNKKNCNLKSILEHLFEYKRIYDNEINIYEEKIKKCNIEISDIKDENKSNIKETEELHNRIETYWTPRVTNLRNKAIEKNKYINALYVILFFTNMNSYIFGYFGMTKYIHIIKKAILILYNVFVGIIKNLIYTGYMIFRNLYIFSLVFLGATIFIYLLKKYTSSIKIFKME
jgi:hypothetical protein